MRSRRLLAVLFLGFSSGIPLALTGATLQAWMKTEHVDLGTIGLFSIVGMPYALKFLWAPLMDRFVPPFLGRRRGWMVLMQAALAATIAALGLHSPAEFPFLTAALAVCVAFFSASQDIVIDAYRTDVLEPEEIGPGAALYISGYRVAMLFSGAVALILADHLPWRTVYLVMAGAMATGAVTSWLAPEPKLEARAPRTLADAVVQPFAEFFRRRGTWPALEVLLFVVLYKIDTVMATAMTTPFMMELGFSKTDIGAVTKGFGLVATLAGTLAGGTLMMKLGMRRSLWVFGLAQGISGLSFTLLANLGHHYPMMVTSIAAENFFSGMGTAAYQAFMMSLCDKRFSATQYALLTSLMALTRVVGGAPVGYLAQAMGWPSFYLLATFAMVPGLLLLTRYRTWAPEPVSS